jgi:hypothetical protein
MLFFSSFNLSAYEPLCFAVAFVFILAAQVTTIRSGRWTPTLMSYHVLCNKYRAVLSRTAIVWSTKSGSWCTWPCFNNFFFPTTFWATFQLIIRKVLFFSERAIIYFFLRSKYIEYLLCSPSTITLRIRDLTWPRRLTFSTTHWVINRVHTGRVLGSLHGFTTDTDADDHCYNSSHIPWRMRRTSPEGILIFAYSTPAATYEH